MPVLAAVAVPHPPLIIPEVGRGEEKRIQHTINAYQQAMRFLARFKPDTVVLTTPHTVMYADYFHISPGKSACGVYLALMLLKQKSKFPTTKISFISLKATARSIICTQAL